MNSPEIKAFIQRNADLFWFIPENRKETISEESLVETILNYGSMEAVIGLIKLMSIDKVAQIFHDTLHRSERRKNNYHELTINFFDHLFRRYAPRYSDGKSS